VQMTDTASSSEWPHQCSERTVNILLEKWVLPCSAKMCKDTFVGWKKGHISWSKFDLTHVWLANLPNLFTSLLYTAHLLHEVPVWVEYGIAVPGLLDKFWQYWQYWYVMRNFDKCATSSM
jgi:hypothetical protein